MDALNMPEAAFMPVERPLAMPRQSLRAAHRDAAAPGFAPDPRARARRFFTFGSALLTTLALIGVFTDLFQIGGLNGFEAALIGLIALTFFWIALSVATSTVGTVRRLRRARAGADAAAEPPEPLDVALLMPIHNEVPWDVFGNAAAMLEALGAGAGDGVVDGALDGAQGPGRGHRYAFFVLSDTTDPAVAAEELRAFAALRARLPAGTALHYRRRAENTDRKTGNIADWIERWGGGYEAMLVLDADSLMSGEAIARLADELARDPSAGLIQTAPRIFGAETGFARAQQFSSSVYGTALAEGLASWADREGNYWGHNAIIRTAAFAACAGLPKLRGFRGGDALILSHDFVEACLLRRAGWGVRILADVKGSYEEVPPTLIDYVRRDRRWCQGNLQHLTILTSRGFHAVSRFHLLHGAVGYLMSPVWMALLLVWAGLGHYDDRSLIVYFSGYDPRPNWPELTTAKGVAVLLFMYGMLLLPKLLGALSLLRSSVRLADLGGARQFGLSMLTEIVLSVAYAPILMVQQTIAVGRSLLGLRDGWAPQVRSGTSYGWGMLARMHALETVIGWALLAGIATQFVSLWLLPIALSLAFAVPLSALSGASLSRHRGLARLLATADMLAVPEIVAHAHARRREVRHVLAQAEPVSVG
jgi:membrane glycosyltransferase